MTWHVTIYHPDWGELIVGSECAENLSLGSEWKAIKSYHRRIKAFIVSPRWEPTPKGWKIEQHGYAALVFRKDDASKAKSTFKIKIDDDWGDIPFVTPEAAKQRVCQVIEQRRWKKRMSEEPTSQTGNLQPKE